jgi:hypothetical protein
MQRFFILCILLGISTTVFGNELKNVQVLPFTTEKEITRYMKKQVAKSLGVKCTFCHDLKDKSKDDNPHKLVAREMMKMLANVNENMVSIADLAQKSGLENWEKTPVVECWSCHRGSTIPEYARPRSSNK